MRFLPRLFENNRAWAARAHERDTGLFDRMAQGQAPAILWIGCGDSRVPAETIVGLQPGQLFVHRNVANLVRRNDASAGAVLQFTVEVLAIQHVVVCGHYGCGGVRAALAGGAPPLVQHWVAPIAEQAERHAAELEALDDEARWRRLCELNVAAQVREVCTHAAVTDAWRAGRPLVVHGWIFDPATGLLTDLDLSRDR
jgi:carbonic anhydrase